MFLLLLVIAASLETAVLASTTITTYDNIDCTQSVRLVTPPETGQCQTNTLGNYSSFKITNPTPSCNVSWHGSDSIGCSSDYMGQLQIGYCYSNVSLIQFTVDCDASVRASAYAGLPASSTFPSGTVQVTGSGSSSTPTTSSGLPSISATSDGGGGLSSSAKSGIIAAGTIAGIVFSGFAIFFGYKTITNNRKVRRLAREAGDREAIRDQIALDDRAMEQRNRQEQERHLNNTANGNEAANDGST